MNKQEAIQNLQEIMDALQEDGRGDRVTLHAFPSTEMGEPDEDQLRAINQLVGYESSASEWFVVPFRASDNLIDRSNCRWHQNVLMQMGMGFNGKSLLVDHMWRTDKLQGFLTSPKMIKQSDCPPEILNAVGYQEYNKEIIRQEGYTWLYMLGVLTADHPAVDAIKSRRYHDVSTGGSLRNIRRLCPNCQHTRGVETSFYETDKKGDYVCPHLPPTPMALYYYGDRDDVEWADYIIVDGDSDEVELSFCVEGMLPGASIIRNGLITC